jgi:hypothetical protein
MTFDGVLNKLIPPVEWIMKSCRPNDLIDRAHLSWLRSKIIITYAYLPLILNGNAINICSKEMFIISGRNIRSKKAEDKLRELGFNRLYFRPNPNISELDWKILMCKKLHIKYFVDDRPFIIEKLQENGITAVEWKE